MDTPQRAQRQFRPPLPTQAWPECGAPGGGGAAPLSVALDPRACPQQRTGLASLLPHWPHSPRAVLPPHPPGKLGTHVDTAPSPQPRRQPRVQGPNPLVASARCRERAGSVVAVGVTGKCRAFLQRTACGPSASHSSGHEPRAPPCRPLTAPAWSCGRLRLCQPGPAASLAGTGDITTTAPAQPGGPPMTSRTKGLKSQLAI